MAHTRIEIPRAPFTRAHRVIDAVSVATLFLAAFFLYRFNLRFLAPVTFHTNDVIFGADTAQTLDAIGRATFDDDMWKHLLFSVTMNPIVRGIARLLSADMQRATVITLAALGAANVAGTFVLLARHVSSQPLAFLLAVLYGVCFSNLVIFSVPETYALSNLMILAYLAILLRIRSRLSSANSLILAGAAGVGSLFNPPLLSLMTIHLALMLVNSPRSWRRWAGTAAANFALAGGLFLAANISVRGWAFFDYSRTYARQWASVRNLLSPGNVLAVGLDFVVYSVAAPVGQLTSALGWRDFRGFFSSFFRFVTLAMVLAGAVVSYQGLLARWRQGDRLGLCLTAWITLMVIFYTYFDPREAMLYSSQVLLPLGLVFASSYQMLKLRPTPKAVALTLAIAWLAINNVTTILSRLPTVRP
jgi:hypothetical protein